MAYKSLIDYYGGGMVKPSDGYQLGGLVAGARRQRDYSGELRGLQQLAEQSARRKQKAQRKGGILKTALGIGGTLLGGPMGAAVGSALGQALGEKSYKDTSFKGGKYAQDIRGQLGKQEKAYKGQSGARIGLAGLAGYMGGKAGGMFGKAASGIKGGVGQIKDIAGFLKEGGTMGDVLGGYAQKIGESGVFGDTGISRGLLGMGAKAGIAPTVTESMRRTMTDEGRKKAFESAENLLTAREGRYKIPGSTEGEWAVPDSDYARSVLTPTVGYDDLAEGPDIEEVEKMPFGSTLREIWGSQTDEEKAQEAARYQPWEAPAAHSPSLATPSFGEELIAGVYSDPVSGAVPQQQPAPSMAGSLMPDMPPAGFSGQDLMIGEEGPDAVFEPFLLPSLLGSDFPGYQPDTGSYREFASDWMPAELQTAGGVRGYQSGGQVGYGTATDPLQALEQMGMGDVAKDPKLEDYIEDLPQFTMGYKQQLGDVMAGGRSSLMDISQQSRMQQAGTGFAGGGAGAVGQARARKELQRGVGTQRRGIVESYQADLLSALADIEAKGGFEFGNGVDQNQNTYALGEAGVGMEASGIPEGWPSRQAFDSWRDAGGDPDTAVNYGWQATQPGATPGYKP